MSVSVEWETLSDTAFGISTFTLLRASPAFVRAEAAGDLAKHTGDVTLECKFMCSDPVTLINIFLSRSKLIR